MELTPEFIQAANSLNNILFGLSGVTFSAETLYQWGVRGGESTDELQKYADEWISHRREKAQDSHA